MVITDFLERDINYVAADFRSLYLAVESEVDIDLSHKPICPSSSQMDTAVEDEELCIVADDVLTRCLQAIGKAENKVRTLSLAFTDMDDLVFKEVTDKLIESVHFVENNGILDLSFNSITTSSTKQIIQWINKGIKFVNLHGNPMCSMRRVEDLCERIREEVVDNLEKVVRLMSHVIFLPEYYIYQTNTNVQIYHQLHEKGYLPDHWLHIHYEFYIYHQRDSWNF